MCVCVFTRAHASLKRVSQVSQTEKCKVRRGFLLSDNGIGITHLANKQRTPLAIPFKIIREAGNWFMKSSVLN